MVTRDQGGSWLESPARQGATHALSCSAPPSVLYDLVADVPRWPAILPHVLHVEHVIRSERADRFQLWALAGDQVRSWFSRRRLDPVAGTIAFEQEHSEPPIRQLAGRWEFRALGDGGSRVELRHWFTLDGSSGHDQVIAAIDENATRNLATLCRLAALSHPIEDIAFSFADQVTLPVSQAEAYGFIHDSDRWPQILPHVNRVVLAEVRPGVQQMEMDATTADGQTHTTRSLRLCFPAERIVYKQLVPPALLLGHCGAWDFAEHPDGGTVVTARHSVAVDPAAVRDVLGAGHSLADTRTYLRNALGASSMATLEQLGDARPRQPARADHGGA